MISTIRTCGLTNCPPTLNPSVRSNRTNFQLPSPSPVCIIHPDGYPIPKPDSAYAAFARKATLKLKKQQMQREANLPDSYSDPDSSSVLLTATICALFQSDPGSGPAHHPSLEAGPFVCCGCIRQFVVSDHRMTVSMESDQTIPLGGLGDIEQVSNHLSPESNQANLSPRPEVPMIVVETDSEDDGDIYTDGSDQPPPTSFVPEFRVTFTYSNNSDAV